MNLTIKQSTNSTENLSSSSVVETLYQLTKPDPVSGLPAADAVLVGRIQVPGAYEDAVNFLNTQFSAANSDNGSDFQVTVLNNNYCIRFSDSEVERVLLEKAVAQGIIQQGEGLTITTLGQVSLGNDLFYKNSIIVNFDEVKYCNLHARAIVRQASNIESVDLTDITYLGNWFAGNCPKLEWFHGFRKGEKGVLHLGKLTEMGSGGTGCFCGCPGLIRVTSMGTVSVLRGVFGGSVNLESVVIPSQCSEVSDTFDGCTKLSTINISQLRKISGSFCKNCTNLEYLDGPDSAQGELYLPFLTGTLYKEAFYNCIKITNVSSLGAITTIGESAFNNCVNLATINIPSTVTSVGANAFNNTAWYNNQPDGGVVIGSCLYKYKGTYIGTYTIPSNITSISPSCFYGQSSLTGIASWPSSQTTIPNACFQNSGLESFDLTGIMTIEGNAFRNSKLTSIVIPNSITTLGDDCFSGCQSLTSITIGTGVTYLGRNIFSMCPSLETLVIPSNVKSLSRDTLTDCKSLQWVRLESTTMVSLDNAGCFDKTNNCIIYVPSDLVDTYKADSKWSSLASRIQAIPTI